MISEIKVVRRIRGGAGSEIEVTAYSSVTSDLHSPCMLQ